MNQAADVVAISTDPAAESRKMDQAIGGAFPLLRDSRLDVIRAFRMDHDMGEITANMGYVIIDKQGIVRSIRIDPMFGDADRILTTLKGL